MRAAEPLRLLAHRDAKVAEDVLHLVAQDDQDDDHHDRDQHQDESVLDHALPLVAGESVEKPLEQKWPFHGSLYLWKRRAFRLASGLLDSYPQAMAWRNHTRG